MVHQFYDYRRVTSTGYYIEKVYTGPDGSASPRWVKTIYDWARRPVSVERPGYGDGVTLLESNYYNDAGQLWKTVSSVLPSGSGIADIVTLMEYNARGEIYRRGLDVDGDDTLDVAEMDRVTESISDYVKDSGSGVWYYETETATYPDDNAAPRLVISVNREQLTGLGAVVSGQGKLVSKSTTTDVYDQETVSTTYVDRDAATVTRKTDVPTSTQDAVAVSINGRTKSQTSPTGVTYTYGYDGLGRAYSVTDPRTGTSYKRYNDKGQVYETEDAAGKVTSYAYDADTGLLASITDPNTETVYYAYDKLKRRKIGEYGATYPVKYVFDDYGQMADMYTFRGTTDLVDTAMEFDGLALGNMDRTQWDYDAATGLLKSNTDADNNAVEYAYFKNGQLETRTWARDSGAVYTSYGYDTDTRQLETVSYSDSTPTITYGYDRLGRTESVQDGQGYRKFDYTAEGALDTETLKVSENGAVIHVLDYSQDGYGRGDGYGLFFDGSSTPALAVDYGYAAVNGRLQTIESAAGSETTYSKYYYVADSDLVDGHSIAASSGASAFFYDRTVYEANRNLIDRVESGFSNNLDYRGNTATTRKNYYDYTNDDAGRRTARADWYNPSGTVTSENNSFDYNEHNELESADFGADTYTYTFDNIGNRLSTSENSTPTTYVPGKLNQYDTVGSATFQYDDDGNLETDGSDWIYIWNAENRLQEMRTWHSDGNPVSGDKKLEFAYDYDGRRYSKTVHTYNGSGWDQDYVNTFTWSGNRIIYQESDSDANLAFVWGLEGKPLAMHLLDDGYETTLYYGHDGNKNVVNLARNVTPSMIVYEHRYTYDAFGNETSGSSTFSGYNPFRFSSEYKDSETGLVAYKYRYYKPSWGRWINRDPIEEQGGLSLYGFVINNALSNIDYLGLEWEIMSDGIKDYTHNEFLVGNLVGEQFELISYKDKDAYSMNEEVDCGKKEEDCSKTAKKIKWYKLLSSDRDDHDDVTPNPDLKPVVSPMGPVGIFGTRTTSFGFIPYNAKFSAVGLNIYECECKCKNGIAEFLVGWFSGKKYYRYEQTSYSITETELKDRYKLVKEDTKGSTKWENIFKEGKSAGEKAIKGQFGEALKSLF